MTAVTRICIRLGNGVLVAVCCFLVAEMANRVSAEVLREPVEIAGLPPVSLDAPARSSPDEDAIVRRNLFGAQLFPIADAPPPEPEEEIETTELPLALVGTVAATNGARGIASLWYEDEREHEILRAGEPLEHLPNVQLARIERRRVILQNDDALEELVLEEGKLERKRAWRDTRANRAKFRALQKRRNVIRSR